MKSGVLLRIGGTKWQAASHHLEENDSARIDVGANIYGMCVDELLGGHIWRGSESPSEPNETGAVSLAATEGILILAVDATDPKIGNFEGAVGSEEAVLRLQVSMGTEALLESVDHAVAEVHAQGDDSV